MVRRLMPRYRRARWRGPVPNEVKGGMVRPLMGVVEHIECGTEAGTNSWFHDPRSQVSAHFGNPKHGPLDQWVDTHDRAWAEAAGNDRWISVENEGKPGDSLTSTQIENLAHLLVWLHRTEGIPLQLTNHVNRKGLGWHGMGGDAWGGHYDCPGEPIKRQRREILHRARVILEGHAK